VTILDQNYFDIALLILCSLFIGFIITPASIWLAKKLDIIDYPGRTARHIHKKPTPPGGRDCDHAFPVGNDPVESALASC